jgi:hypothetical protein
MDSRHGDTDIGYFTGNSCSDGYYYLDITSNAAHTDDDFVSAVFAAPPDTKITSYTIWRSPGQKNVKEHC